MGGAAAIINGRVTERLLQPRPVKRSLIGRLLGKEKFSKPREIEIGNERLLTEVSSEDFYHLPKEFESFLRKMMPSPWQCTNWFFDYLSMDVISIYLRGERDKSEQEPNWYLQFTFTGCSGTGEISAELGSHWVEKWIQIEGVKIQDTFLNPYGFECDLSQIEMTDVVFVPFEGLGYGRRFSDTCEADPEGCGSRLFEFDYSQTAEIHEGKNPEKLRLIDDKFGDLGIGGRCLCQLCSPTFTPPKFEF